MLHLVSVSTQREKKSNTQFVVKPQNFFTILLIKKLNSITIVLKHGFSDNKSTIFINT